MRTIQDHYFYLFISKFLEIKISLNKEIEEIQKSNGQDKKASQQNSSSNSENKNFLQAIM